MVLLVRPWVVPTQMLMLMVMVVLVLVPGSPSTGRMRTTTSAESRIASDNFAELDEPYLREGVQRGAFRLETNIGVERFGDGWFVVFRGRGLDNRVAEKAALHIPFEHDELVEQGIRAERQSSGH